MLVNNTHVNPKNRARVTNKRSKDKDPQRPDNSRQRPTNKNKNNSNSRWQCIVKFGAQSQKKCRKTSGPIKAGLQSKMLLHFRPRSVKLAKHEPGTIQIINRPNSKAIPCLQHSANRPTLEFGKATQIKRCPGKLLDVFFFMYPLSSWTSFISGKMINDVNDWARQFPKKIALLFVLNSALWRLGQPLSCHIYRN